MNSFNSFRMITKMSTTQYSMHYSNFLYELEVHLKKSFDLGIVVYITECMKHTYRVPWYSDSNFIFVFSNERLFSEKQRSKVTYATVSGIKLFAYNIMSVQYNYSSCIVIKESLLKRRNQNLTQLQRIAEQLQQIKQLIQQ